MALLVLEIAKKCAENNFIIQTTSGVSCIFLITIKSHKRAGWVCKMKMKEKGKSILQCFSRHDIFPKKIRSIDKKNF